MQQNEQDNIIFSLNEDEKNNGNDSEFDINEILEQFENANVNSDFMLPHIIHYSDNFTIKELLLICDYYGFGKELKSNKCNKDIIVQYLVEFEKNPLNNVIVSKRQNMWFYINELKNDKFMKKYVLW
jgi:hypothetical protein